MLGTTPELLARLRPHFSLHVTGARDPASANPTVLAAMRAVLGGDAALTGSAIGLRGTRESIPALVGITAVAAGPNGPQFVRRAVLRRGQGRGVNPVRVLAWNTPGAE